MRWFRRLPDGTEQRCFIQKLKSGTAIFRCFGSAEELAGRSRVPKELGAIIGEVAFYGIDKNGNTYVSGKAPLLQWGDGVIISESVTLPQPLSKDTMLRTITTIYPASKNMEA